MQGEQERVTYRSIFAEPEFRALFVSRALSTVGDYVARAALVVAVFTETGSEALMGVTFALTVLPDLVGGPLLAGLADRYPRRAVMVATDLTRAVLLLVMAIPGMPLLALWALLFAVRLIDPPFNSAYISTMAVVLPGRRLIKGSAITQLVNHVSYTAGYGLGSVVVAIGGLSVVLVLNAATFLISAVVILLGVVARPATALVGASSSLLGTGARAATGSAALRGRTSQLDGAPMMPPGGRTAPTGTRARVPGAIRAASPPSPRWPPSVRRSPICVPSCWPKDWLATGSTASPRCRQRRSTTLRRRTSSSSCARKGAL